MTYEFKYLIHLVWCGASGRIPHPPVKPVNWKKIVVLAGQQCVMPLVSYVIYKYDVTAPEQLKKECHKTALSAAVTFYKQREATLSVLDTFENAKIPAVLIKGISSAGNYSVPEYRPSSDIDILIDEQYEKRAYEVLKSEGFDVSPRQTETHAASCYHPRIGHLELHVSLYGRQDASFLFYNVDKNLLMSEPPIMSSYENRVYKTLGDTDALICLMLHITRHLIKNGANLRLMLDLVMHYTKRHASIDIKRFDELLSKTKCSTLFNAVLSAFGVYGGADERELFIDSVADKNVILALLDDVEACGGISFEDNGREQFAQKVIRKRHRTERGVLYYYDSITYFIFLVFRSVFIPLSMLREKCDIVIKYPILIPFMYIYIGFALIKKSISKLFHKNTNTIDKTIENKERTLMFKMIGII